jgi:hypothetical protein
MRTCLVIALVACSSYEAHLVDSGGGSSTCPGAVYDPCTSNDQCMSLNCHAYNTSGIQVCTQACTPGDNSTCPVDATGANGFCNNMGNCKPAKANTCPH